MEVTKGCLFHTLIRILGTTKKNAYALQPTRQLGLPGPRGLPGLRLGLDLVSLANQAWILGLGLLPP